MSQWPISEIDICVIALSRSRDIEKIRGTTSDAVYQITEHGLKKLEMLRREAERI